ncbi:MULTISPECIES: hypothetical protein [unclassified Streptomyces]|uniref:hypothetical protein n=1 Tax=unclassified Streptomyces TaxID=2593676 RepID=UPI004042B7F4
MSELMRARLSELEHEYQRGESELRATLDRETALRETLLRISGAIQVLRELMAHGVDERSAGGPTTTTDVGSVPETEEATEPNGVEPPVVSVP